MRKGTGRIVFVLMMALMCGMLLLPAEKAFAAGSVVIGNVKLTASQDVIAPVTGEQITFPTFFKAEEANPSATNNQSIRLSMTWFNKDEGVPYDQEDGNPGKEFTTGTWMLFLSIQCDNGTLLPPGSKFEALGLSEIQFAGLTWRDNNHTDTSVVYEAEFQVAPAVKTKIQGFTLKANGAFSAPAAGASITYPDIVSVASTEPAGLEKQLMVTYGWWSDGEQKMYYQDHNDTGIFAPGEYKLSVFVELVDKVRYEIVWKNFEYGTKLYEMNLGNAAFHVGALSVNVIDYEAAFTVKKMSVADCTVAKVEDQIYTGKVIRPKVKVKAGSKTLTPGTDYTIAYQKNKSVGKAAVIITGKGRYTGKKMVPFRIVPRGTTIRGASGARRKGKVSIQVKWNKQSRKMATKRISGYQLQVATDKKFTKNVKSVKVAGYKRGSRTVTGLKAAKKYYVRIRSYMSVSGKKYISKWSKVKTVKVK